MDLKEKIKWVLRINLLQRFAVIKRRKKTESHIKRLWSCRHLVASKN